MWTITFHFIQLNPFGSISGSAEFPLQDIYFEFAYTISISGFKYTVENKMTIKT